MDTYGFEDVVAAFTTGFNDRDWDQVGELLAEDCTSDALGGSDRAEVVDSLADLSLRHPGLLLTVGRAGDELVAAAWLPDHESRTWRQVGYLSFSSNEDSLVEHIDYVAEPDADADPPEPEDLPEWFDWTEWEEGVPPDGD
jgi:hypothetical protein